MGLWMMITGLELYSVMANIQLSPKALADLQKRAVFMKMLESIGAFDIKSGTLTVNFDSAGAISSVEVRKLYRDILKKTPEGV